MKFFTSFLFLVTLFVFTACSPRVYTAPNAASVTAAHSIIALAPLTVTIIGRPKDDPAALLEAAKADVYTFQREMYSWFLRRKQQNRLVGVDILDPATTNAKLKQAGYETNQNSMTPKQMAELLGVDAVVTSTFNTNKPMSDGAAVALGLLIGVWGNTNETTANLSLHDPTEGMIWNYDWTAGGTFSSPASLVNGLMRNASKKMPYKP